MNSRQRRVFCRFWSRVLGLHLEFDDARAARDRWARWAGEDPQHLAREDPVHYARAIMDARKEVIGWRGIYGLPLPEPLGPQPPTPVVSAQLIVVNPADADREWWSLWTGPHPEDAEYVAKHTGRAAVLAIHRGDHWEKA